MKYYIILGTFIIFSLLQVQLCLGNDSLKDKSFYEMGMENFYKQNYLAAADYLGQVADTDKDNVWARYYYVYSIAMLGKKREAKKWISSLSSIKETEHYKLLITFLNEDKKQAKVAKSDTNPKSDSNNEANSKKVTLKKEDSEQKVIEKFDDLDKAQEFIDSENYEKAINLINNFLKENKKNGRAYQLLGIIYFNKNKYKDSIDNFKKAFKFGINDFESYFMAAEACLSIQNIDEALTWYKKASKINNNDVFLKLSLADLYCKKSDYTNATNIYKEILKRDSKIIEADVGLAKIELDKGFDDIALKHINSILESHKNNAKARYLKAQVFLKQKDYIKALEEAKLASLYNKANIEYKIFCSLVKVRNLLTKEAIEEIENILLDYPNNVYALSALGEAYFTCGKEDEGRKMLDKADNIKKIPQTPQLLAMIEFSLGNYDKADEYYKEYCKRSGYNPESLLEYAEFTEIKQDMKLSIEAYSKIIVKFPDTPFADKAKESIDKIKKSSSGLSKRSYGFVY